MSIIKIARWVNSTIQFWVIYFKAISWTINVYFNKSWLKIKNQLSISEQKIKDSIIHRIRNTVVEDN